ncbi:undecaprenyl/decaprenyl-phosphate alpha-N-acetylglucosaminyl 1-phosphate transferase [Galbitalea sp. SE-J8]|uniref:MraY family glycosyltransferase n=1 Tax=Galbitalea sp. SE-J8 TaxID=3054952 RepID=UPI00259C7591|nr:undecaprenyl/decaprenyl-phosphate alpha-N-acetylglucosaminyl 1-phosphate transferase [Galbitalea sp. SE-J8]MDM4763449.1 undecaprenyl/decaprenyl-phosphate alpha-N-acetylglucosaminyl 1-phosphate transferase [Galbitalea sp. SE-J8]
MRLYLLAAATAAVVAFVFAWVILRLSLRFRLYPQIRARDVHESPTPRLGGAAMFLGVLAAFGAASQFGGLRWLGSPEGLGRFDLIFSEPSKIFGILGASLLIVVIGVVDDLWDLEWWTKLAGQVIAGGILAYSGVTITTLPVFGAVAILPSTVSLGITVFAVVLVMNAVNFIDGLDGLVAGVAIIANGVFFLYSFTLSVFVGQSEYFNLAALISAVLIGACAGFLPFNFRLPPHFRPARIFMGDSGAMLVGLLMAASAITVTTTTDTQSWGGRQLLPAFIPILLPVAILVLPLLDFALAVIRRLRAGKSPFSADRLHLHHRLLDIGHSHLQAVLIFYGWTAVISFGVFAYIVLPWEGATVIIAAGVLVCGVATIVPLLRRHPLDAPPTDETPVQSAPVASAAKPTPASAPAPSTSSPTPASPTKGTSL